MPTYEYGCKGCGYKWDEVQKMSDPMLDTCPQCKEPKAQRLISHGNFILKGGGWYTTGGYGTKNVPSESDSTSKSTSTSTSAATPSTPAPATTPSSSAPSTASTTNSDKGKSA